MYTLFLFFVFFSYLQHPRGTKMTSERSFECINPSQFFLFVCLFLNREWIRSSFPAYKCYNMLAEVLHCSFSLLWKVDCFIFSLVFRLFFVFFVVVFFFGFPEREKKKKWWSCSVRRRCRRRWSPVVVHNECNVVERYVVWNVSEGVRFSSKKCVSAMLSQKRKRKETKKVKKTNKKHGAVKKKKKVSCQRCGGGGWEFQEAALVTTWRADREISSYCVGFFSLSPSQLGDWPLVSLVSPQKDSPDKKKNKNQKNNFHSRCAPWLYVAPAAPKIVCLPLTDSS